MKKFLLMVCAGWCTAAAASSPDLLNEVYRAVERTLPASEQPKFERTAALAVLQAFDPGGALLNADQDAGSVAGKPDLWSGVGFSLKEGELVIDAVAEDSPAAVAGVQVGQVVTAIAGTSSQGMSVETASLRMDQALRADGPLVLSVMAAKDDKTPMDLSFDAVGGAPALSTEERWAVGIGYVRVRGLYGSAGSDVAALLKAWDLENLSGAILDLRAAEGGEPTAVPEIAGLFSGPEEHLYTIQDAEDQDVEKVRSTWGGRLSLPLMVLVDEHTRGAPELLAAVLHGSAGGVMLLGRPTAGDLGLRSAVPLASGATLLMSTRRVLTADGTRYQSFTQVVPDVEVSQVPGQLTRFVDPDDFEELSDEEREDLELNNRLRGDPALRRASDILLGLKALNRRPPAVTHDPEN